MRFLKKWQCFSFILALFIIFFYISCAPLRPLAPPQKSQSTKAKASQQAQKSNETFGNQKNQSITGITEWDKVLSPWLGTPYLVGGSTKRGADCSGFVSSVYLEKEGMYIPRTTAEEFKIGKSVDKNKLVVGDLVFFGEKGKVNHVGIFVGSGNFIHASTSKGVMISPMNDIYWEPLYMGARRYL